MPVIGPLDAQVRTARTYVDSLATKTAKAFWYLNIYG